MQFKKKQNEILKETKLRQNMGSNESVRWGINSTLKHLQKTSVVKKLLGSFK